jgi:hypothetical protein
VVGGFEGGDLRFFLGEGADEAGGGEVLFGLCGDVGEHGLDALEAGVDAGTEVLDEDGGERKRQEGEQGEPWTDAQHEREREGGEDERVGRVHDGRAEELADCI